MTAKQIIEVEAGDDEDFAVKSFVNSPAHPDPKQVEAALIGAGFAKASVKVDDLGSYLQVVAWFASDDREWEEKLRIEDLFTGVIKRFSGLDSPYGVSSNQSKYSEDDTWYWIVREHVHLRSLVKNTITPEALVTELEALGFQGVQVRSSGKYWNLLLFATSRGLAQNATGLCRKALFKFGLKPSSHLEVSYYAHPEPDGRHRVILKFNHSQLEQ